MTRRDREKPGGCSDPVAGYALRICLMHKVVSSSAGADLLRQPIEYLP
jgi:hypothetical protein